LQLVSLIDDASGRLAQTLIEKREEDRRVNGSSASADGSPPSVTPSTSVAEQLFAAALATIGHYEAEGLLPPYKKLAEEEPAKSGNNGNEAKEKGGSDGRKKTGDLFTVKYFS
jgi:hypothetical protein